MRRTLIAGILALITAITLFPGFANAQPVIDSFPGSFTFQGTELNSDILLDTLLITNTGDGILNWTASWNESWLDVVPISGTAPSTVEIKVTAENLSVGDYTDQIILEAPDAANSPYNIVVNFHVSTPCQGRCGNMNGDASVNVSDALWVIRYVFLGGQAPSPVKACGNANGDTAINISDAVYIINFVFTGGPPPNDCHPGIWDDYGGDCCPY